MAAMNVLIGTPTAGGVVKVQYAHTIANTVRDLACNGIGVDYMTFDGADVAAARNQIASYMLGTGYSHLFFVDSDMWFDAALCRRMIGMDKRVLACACAKRKLDLRRLERNLGAASRSIDDALALSLDYNVALPAQGVRVENGMCRVEACGMGVMLIQRQAFEEMIDKGVSGSMPGAAELGLRASYDFFSQVRDRHGVMMSEDYSFCHKWREGCGGEVWALVDADVRHVGDMAYGVPFLRRLNAAAATNADDGPVQA